MQLCKTLDEFTLGPQGCVVTVGNFDGVHLGHQAILARARDLAREHGLGLVAVTFDPTPVKLLRPDKAPPVITPVNVKATLLAEQELDALVIVHSTPEFLSQSPEQFAQGVLKEQLAARYVVEGQTFSFGKRRAGTMVSLDALGRQFGFQAELVPARTIDADGGNVAVSSTVVRQHVATGALDEARRCLGRFFAVAGTIVPGRGHGRELGFPTANIQFYDPDQLVPEDGVFAGFARIGDDFETAWSAPEIYHAAVSIGRSETIPDGPWQTEAFLLDYEPASDELYNKHMVLSLTEKLRPQERFDSTEALRQAITADCAVVRQKLNRLQLS